jgi:diguanylate cyclase (GGDEF)-like protein
LSATQTTGAELPELATGARARVELHDALTGIGSRTLLEMAADQPVPPASRSVVLIDIDQFKAVNDTYGHTNGDRVLRTVARRLAAVAGGEHLLVRLSCDEFAVVISSPERSVCESVAQALYDAVRHPIPLSGGTLFLDAGVGIALAHDKLTLWDLVSRAGASIHPLKQSGRLPRIVVFNEESHGEILDQLALSLELRAALRRRELVLHYQPIVDMATRDAVGFEALVRWSNPARGLIPPLRFIPLAEAAGLMPELGEWVLEQACTQARTWTGRAGTPPYVSVNISIQQLEDPDFITRFERALSSSGLEPTRLKVEVTESVLAHGVDEVAPPLERIRSMGVGVLLDDFGTGYSSLGYLRELPLDGVKLDRVFTRDLTVSAGAWALARSVVALLGQLHLEIIAEGLETAAHLAQLRSLGCQLGQGYYFARPQPAEELRFERFGKASA